MTPWKVLDLSLATSSTHTISPSPTLMSWNTCAGGLAQLSGNLTSVTSQLRGTFRGATEKNEGALAGPFPSTCGYLVKVVNHEEDIWVADL